MKFSTLTRTALCSALCLAPLWASTVEAKRLSHKDAKREPKARIGSLPVGNTPGSGGAWIDPEDLGRHTYRAKLFGGSEDNGILYTCRGGFIDIAHLRKATDWAAHLAIRIEKALQKKKSEFQFSGKEPDKYKIEFNYPSYWDTLPEGEKQAIIERLSLKMGQELSFLMSLWHEILTWHGYKSTFVIPERPSAFSYEDMYSHAVGVYLAAKAFNNSELDYDDAVTLALNEFLEQAGAVSRDSTRDAVGATKDLWWDSSKVWPMDKLVAKRHFDIGLSDGKITPWLIRGFKDCDPSDERNPLNLEVPSSSRVLGYDLENFYIVRIKPKVWGFMRQAFPNSDERPDTEWIRPEEHLPTIMDQVIQEAKEKLGENVDVPYP